MFHVEFFKFKTPNWVGGGGGGGGGGRVGGETTTLCTKSKDKGALLNSWDL